MNPISTTKQRNRLKLAFVVTAGLLLLALATLVGCSGERETSSPAPETVSNVSVLSVQPANVRDLVEAVGRCARRRRANLPAK